MQFKGNKDADFYEVYEKDGDSWKLLTGSSSTTIYLPKVSRSASAQGTTQELKVVAVGKMEFVQKLQPQPLIGV